MSLWTPDGERPIRTTPNGPPTAPEPDEAAPMSPDQEEQARAMAHELAEARARLLETPASTVVVNHALGIYELAAIHLTADQPKMSEARLALDALAALVEGLSGRLGEAEPTLVEALHHARLAFVQQAQGDQEAAAAEAGATSTDQSSSATGSDGDGSKMESPTD